MIHNLVNNAMRQRPPPVNREYTRSMRKDATLAENLLWQSLRGRQLSGVKFRRQTPLDGYILDFVSFEAKLIIEVDGSQHADSLSDRIRDAHFARSGFRILRFWNDVVIRDLDAVCRVILFELQRR